MESNLSSYPAVDNAFNALSRPVAELREAPVPASRCSFHSRVLQASATPKRSTPVQCIPVGGAARQHRRSPIFVQARRLEDGQQIDSTNPAFPRVPAPHP